MTGESKRRIGATETSLPLNSKAAAVFRCHNDTNGLGMRHYQHSCIVIFGLKTSLS